jgi:tRNA (cmo5U34)-methyltransferase
MSKVGDEIHADNGSWTFAGDISNVFDAHISKSIPHYSDGEDLIAKISDFFLSKDSVCYDLGTSTGEILFQIAKRQKNKKTTLIGFDCVPEMIAKAREKCAEFPNVSMIEADILDVTLEPCDLVISAYTMQFVKPKNRQMMFDRIYQSLNWGGGFLLFEKVRAPDARFQDMMSILYSNHKAEQGFSPEEILGKTDSLKGIQEPFSTQGNLDLLRRAGFGDIMTVFKYVCFEGFLAIK